MILLLNENIFLTGIESNFVIGLIKKCLLLSRGLHCNLIISLLLVNKLVFNKEILFYVVMDIHQYFSIY